MIPSYCRNYTRPLLMIFHQLLSTNSAEWGDYFVQSGHYRFDVPGIYPREEKAQLKKRLAQLYKIPPSDFLDGDEHWSADRTSNFAVIIRSETRQHFSVHDRRWAVAASSGGKESFGN